MTVGFLVALFVMLINTFTSLRDESASFHGVCEVCVSMSLCYTFHSQQACEQKCLKCSNSQQEGEKGRKTAPDIVSVCALLMKPKLFLVNYCCSTQMSADRGYVGTASLTPAHRHVRRTYRGEVYRFMMGQRSNTFMLFSPHPLPKGRCVLWRAQLSKQAENTW